MRSRKLPRMAILEGVVLAAAGCAGLRRRVQVVSWNGIS